jgi:hypothetical protein
MAGIPTYHGIFKYSPNNPKPKRWRKGSSNWKVAQYERREIEKFLESLKTDKAFKDETRATLIARYERKLFCLTIKHTEHVYYIADDEFNILFETYPIFEKGNFSAEVKRAEAEYGMTGKALRTSDTMEDLKVAVRVHKMLEEKHSEKYS